MRKVKIQLLITATMTSMAVGAQTTGNASKMLGGRLDFGVTAGVTGVGFDLAMPMTDYLRVRSGFSYMPRVEVPMTFKIQVGDDPSTSDRKFNRMSSMLESLTGNPVENHVEMIGRPTMWNWSLLADVFPLKNNKHWRVTVGVYIGPKLVAESYNKTESMPSLMGVDIYNNLYNKLHGVSRRDLPGVKIIDFGPGYENVFTDPNLLLYLQEKLDAAGRMGIHMGTYTHDVVNEKGEVIHQKGDDYVMEPDANHMVKVAMKVDAIKPYIGVGYEGRLDKRNDRLYVAADAGIMFWGGTPSLKTHDGTDLINDVENIKGKVGDYVKIMSKLGVCPVINLRCSYVLFK